MLGELVVYSELIFQNGASYRVPIDQSSCQVITLQQLETLNAEIRNANLPYLQTRAILNIYGLTLTLMAFYYFYLMYVILLRQVGNVRKNHYV
jgi:hypothetical protein